MYDYIHHLISLPTRRSSDLLSLMFVRVHLRTSNGKVISYQQVIIVSYWYQRVMPMALITCRSEEHTSELQSRFDLVCRLLLEKKKQLWYYLVNKRLINNTG